MTTDPAARPTLAEFLLARIAEDEADARDTDPLPPGAVFDHDVTGWWRTARVLAECAAKRRIMAEHMQRPGAAGCYDCETPLCRFRQFLAEPYADHPEFREEWRP